MKKKANIRGKRWKNGNFSLYLGEKISFLKEGWGKNNRFWVNIHPCYFVPPPIIGAQGITAWPRKHGDLYEFSCSIRHPVGVGLTEGSEAVLYRVGQKTLPIATRFQH